MQLQVVSFIQHLPGCKEQASVFREEVSGLCPDPVVQILGMRAESSDLLSHVIHCRAVAFRRQLQHGAEFLHGLLHPAALNFPCSFNHGAYA